MPNPKNSFPNRSERESDLESPLIADHHVVGEIPVHGASRHRDQPRRDVRDRAVAGPGVPRRADHGDAVLHGVEGADRDAVVEQRGGVAAEGDGEDVHAVVYGRVEGGQDVRVEALVAGDRRPADLVGGDPGPRGAALGGAEAVAEDAGAGDEAAAGGGEGVGPVALLVAGGVEGGIEGSHHGGVASVIVSGADQLPAGRCSRRRELISFAFSFFFQNLFPVFFSKYFNRGKGNVYK